MDADTGKTELASSPEREQVKLNILIVDDERSIRTMMEGFIEASTVPSQVGLIQLVANGQEALDVLEKNEGGFNAVLTDGQMPVMGGLELAKKIKENGWDIVVGLMSGELGKLGLSNPETQASVMDDHGIAALLPKPFNLSQFGKFMQKLRTDVTVRNTETQAPNPQ